MVEIVVKVKFGVVVSVVQTIATQCCPYSKYFELQVDLLSLLRKYDQNMSIEALAASLAASLAHFLTICSYFTNTI